MTVTVAYVCHQCGTRLGDALPWCHVCRDDVLAVRVTGTTQPEPIRTGQRIAICQLFRLLGEMHKATRMRDLSRYIGRHHPTRDAETEAWEKEHEP